MKNDGIFERLSNYISSVKNKDYSELESVLEKRNAELIANGYPGFDVKSEIRAIKAN